LSADTPRPSSSLPTSYFDTLYERDADPWRFRTSAYERAKYDATLAALPRPRYRRALEVGCSIGVLSGDLSEPCDALLAVDAAEKALAAARAACADKPNVRFARLRAPDEWPPEGETFDLILLSEMVYYLDRTDVSRLADRVGASLAPGGDCLLVHWTGDTDYPLSGDAASAAFIAAASPFAVVHQAGADRALPPRPAPPRPSRGISTAALAAPEEAARMARRIRQAAFTSRRSAEAGTAPRAKAGEAVSSACQACQNSRASPIRATAPGGSLVAKARAHGRSAEAPGRPGRRPNVSPRPAPGWLWRRAVSRRRHA
jgi:SAM-dependent methyltransferase